MAIDDELSNLLIGDASPPKDGDEKLALTLCEARARLPAPVFWLLGKTQSGKTSIIRGLTGATDAEIGDGFRPCTRTARLYPFPDAEQPIVQFLDTRGLGEAHYDPTEDMAVAARQAHVILVVVKACDHALEPLVAPLRTIRKANPRWHVIVAQTSLHEAYPRPVPQHITPYPFATEQLPETVPQELARSLAIQRETLSGLACFLLRGAKRESRQAGEQQHAHCERHAPAGTIPKTDVTNSCYLCLHCGSFVDRRLFSRRCAVTVAVLKRDFTF